MTHEAESWRMRYEHEIVRELPVERRLVQIDTDDVMEGVVPSDTGEPYPIARPNFARGQERDPARLERFVEDRFSRGQEDDPLVHQQVHEGDFATGLATTPRHPETELSGRFARGQQLVDPDNPNEDRLAS